MQDPREDILVVKVRCLQCIISVSHTHANFVISDLIHMPIVTPGLWFLQLSHSWTLPIGSLVVPIRELLSEPELVLDQWFHLDGASPESQALLRAELKVRELSVYFCHFLYFFIPLSLSLYVPFSVSNLFPVSFSVHIFSSYSLCVTNISLSLYFCIYFYFTLCNYV